MVAFINEFHYDNSGTDAGEFVEVALTAGTNLSGWSILLYNGTNGAVYDTKALTTGTVTTHDGYDFVTINYVPNGIQNGGSGASNEGDAIALVNGSTVVEFIGYEGNVTATGGAALGLTSTNVGAGIYEPGTVNGTSISRIGTASDGTAFNWAVTTTVTPGNTNQGQSFGGPASVSVADVSVVEGNSGQTDMVFTVSRGGNTATAFTVDYATSNGTATAGSDYDAASGTISFAAGQSTATVTVHVAGDTVVEPDETLTLTLSNATNGATISDASAVGTITNDDASAPLAPPFLNEFHYDNAGTDAGEFVEVAGVAGTNLTGYSLALYNGNPAQLNVYATTTLSGVIADQQGGYGTLSFATAGIQNGGAGANGEPDAIALVDPNGHVVEFISYEGSFTAASGPAAGMTSVNVGDGVYEPGTVNGTSIARVGTGTQASDFHWEVSTDTHGAVNAGQTFGTPAPFFTVNDINVQEGDSGTSVATFTVTRGGATTPVTVDYATADGTATAGSDYVATSGTLSFGEGQTTATVSVTINGDTDVEPSELFTLNLSNPTGGATITDAQGQAVIQNDDTGPLTFTLIHDIQGSAFYSPILAADGIHAFNVKSTELVTVQAVVTAIDDSGTRQGFFLAEEGSQWDDNPLTSEGIFVMTRDDAGVGTTFASFATGITIGETVTVSAYVEEYQAFQTQARTMLVTPTLVAQANDNVALPTVVLDGSPGHAIPNAIVTSQVPDYFDSSDDPTDTFNPDTDALDFLETVEGMRVTIPNMVVADGFVGLSEGEAYFKAYSLNSANPDQINSRGGYTIAGDPPNSPPNTATPNDDTHYGGRTLHDGDTNPDILELDFSGAGMGGSSGFANSLTMGDTLGTVSGVFDYDFATPKLYVTDPVTLTDTTPVQEVNSLVDDARSLRVATFNVENLDPGDGAARFQALANAIATNLDSPDIISVEEIQDNNGESAGGTDASQTWTMLVNAVNAATGKHYQYVDQDPTNNAEGGAPNGNIRVGFLYNTDRVQLGDLAANATLAERRQYTDRIGDGVRDAGDKIAFDDSMIASSINSADYQSTRKSLMGEFTFNGNTVYVLANHLPSKSGGSDDPYQLDQNLPAGQPENSDWEQRNQVADDIYRMMNVIGTTDTDARIVSGGDYNDFYFYRPLEVATGYVNPDGTARVGGIRLDNLTVTDLPEAERFTYDFDGNSQAIDHILVDQNLGAVSSYDIVHINTGYNAKGVDPALSDHDPAVAQFDFRSFDEKLVGGAGADSLDGFGGADTLIGAAGADTLTGGAGNDLIDGGADTDLARFSGARAEYTFTRNADGSITVTDTVASRDGADVVVNVEQLGFSDGTVTIDQAFAGISRTGTSAKETLTGTALDDKLYGYANNDTLNGLAGRDSLYGGQGNDTILAGDDDDKMHGGAGDDSIIAGNGNDYIVGGLGNDKLEGDAGADIFFFGKGEGRDTVLDYTPGQDVVHLATGVSLTSAAVGDYNYDGATDLQVMLSGGGVVTFLGVTALNQLTVVANQTLQISDVG